jgi:hypothetical protein
MILVPGVVICGRAFKLFGLEEGHNIRQEGFLLRDVTPFATT